MRNVIVLAAAGLLALAGAVASAQQANAVQAAAKTLNTSSIYTLQFSGSGQGYELGQAPTATEPWPVRPIKSYQATIDYTTASAQIQLVRTMPTPQPRGGGAPFVGEQRQNLFISRAYAWAQPPAPAGGGDAPPPQPQPAAATDRMLWLWATPHGFVRAALGNPTIRPVPEGTEVSVLVGGRYRMVGLINKANHVERVQTWVPNDVMGDMLVETRYSDYRDFGGVLFPARIVQLSGGHPTLDLTISAVQANPPIDITVPDPVMTAPPPPAPTATSQKVTDGVFWITGGSHHSLAVDMGDHAVVVEAPQNEARSEVVIAETKKVLANKPIRYVVNTHVHFDHSGGLRTYVDEGATVVTHQANQAFFEKAWAAPRTIAPDRLAKSGRKPAFQGVTDRAELKGTNGRVLELHVLRGNPHNEQTLVAWLPKERILFQSDMMNPPAPNAQVPPPTPTISNFYDNLARLKIDPEQIVGGHGNRIATRADLNAVAGKGTGTN